MSEIKQSRREMLTETPIPPLILRLAVPTIISMLVTALYNSADTYFVGRISTEATAAVGLVFSVMAVIQAMGFFCGQGSGNYISRMLGAGEKEKANYMATTGFAVSLILGTIVMILGNVFIYQIVDALGATPSIVEDTVIYLRIILIGAPFMAGQFVINNQLRFQGSAFYAMIGLITGAVINVALDPLLILYFKMGVAGAAIATISGQIISFFVLLIGSRQGENIRLNIRNIRLNGHYLLEIINGGAPSLMRQGLTAISALLLNNYAGRYGGEAAIAGMSIVSRVAMMMFSAVIGFGQGYQPVCSYNYGAGNKKRVREGFFFCVKGGTIFLTILAVISYIYAPQIIGWFRDDEAVIAVGTVALRWQACALPLATFTVISNMMLQAMGKGVKGSITSSARNGICFIPLILILPKFYGLLGVEITQACAEVMAILITGPIVASELIKLKYDDVQY